MAIRHRINKPVLPFKEQLVDGRGVIPWKLENNVKGIVERVFAPHTTMTMKQSRFDSVLHGVPRSRVIVGLAFERFETANVDRAIFAWYCRSVAFEEYNEKGPGFGTVTRKGYEPIFKFIGSFSDGGYASMIENAHYAIYDAYEDYHEVNLDYEL